MDAYHLFTDGSLGWDRQTGGLGMVLLDPQGKQVFASGKPSYCGALRVSLDTELEALLEGLRRAKRHTSSLVIFTDFTDNFYTMKLKVPRKEIMADIRKELRNFRFVHFQLVNGNCNMLAHRWARSSMKRGLIKRWGTSSVPERSTSCRNRKAA